MAAGTAGLAGSRAARRVASGRYRPLPDLTPGEVARFYRSMIAAGHGLVRTASRAPGAARSRSWPTSSPRRAAPTAGRTGAGRAPPITSSRRAG